MAIGIEVNAISKQEVEVLRWYVQNYVQIFYFGKKMLSRFDEIHVNSFKFFENFFVGIKTSKFNIANKKP